MSTVLTHGGLAHRYPKSKLKELWKIAAPRLGYTPTEIRYVCELIDLTSKQDFEPNAICVVFYGPSKLSVKIGMPRRSMSRSEAKLVEDGWLAMTCSKRGQRHGDRNKDGDKKIRWAAGINLGPLIDRAAELQEIADEIEAELTEMETCRKEINAIRRAMIDAGFEADAQKTYPRGRPSEVTCFGKLQIILKSLREVCEKVLGAIRQPNSPTGSAKTTRPFTIYEPNYSHSTARTEGKTDKPVVDLSSLAFVATVGLRDAINVYSDRHDPLSAVSMACRDRCDHLGISDNRWMLTKRKFGVPLAALFIAVIDRNSQRPENDKFYARDPQKCLSGMTWRYAKGELNLAGMIAEIKRTAARRDQRHEESKVTLVPTAPHLVREWARPFPSTPTQRNPRAIGEISGGRHGFAFA